MSDELKAAVLAAIAASPDGMSADEVASAFRLRLKPAQHLMQKLKPRAVALVFVPRRVRWVDAARAAELQAEIDAWRKDRNTELRAEDNARRRGRPPPKPPEVRRVASVWDLAL